MLFIVKIDYTRFNFSDKNNAIIFAEIAKEAAANDISVTIELHSEDEDE